MLAEQLTQMPPNLRDVVGPVDAVDMPEQGATSTVWIVSGPRGRFVVKRATQAPYHEWLRREYEVLQGLAGTGLPVPRPLAYAEADADGHSVWLVMEHLPGVPLRDRLRREADPGARQRLLFAFGKALAEIHGCPVPPSLACSEPWLDRTLRLAEQYLRSYPVDGDAALLERLRTERPAPVTPCLIHGDYTLDNVLVAGFRVTGVIDWCWGGCGDPRYDLALATRITDEAFGEPGDREAFDAGYGGRRLTHEEYEYFVGIYEFF